MLTVSKRISTIASLVPNGARVCDIGTDHAYLGIHLIETGITNNVIATDINQKPLLNAKKNIEKLNISGIELRLCDGAAAINDNEVDTFVIAGMGGEVIAGIIKRSENLFFNSGISLILQPTTSPEFLREYLFKNGFSILKEIPVFENRKLYSVMLVKYTGKATYPSPLVCYIGLLTPESYEGSLYIQKQYDRCLKCAKALENNVLKQNKFKFYEDLCCSIEDYIKTFKE